MTRLSTDEFKDVLKHAYKVVRSCGITFTPFKRVNVVDRVDINAEVDGTLSDPTLYISRWFLYCDYEHILGTLVHEILHISYITKESDPNRIKIAGFSNDWDSDEHPRGWHYMANLINSKHKMFDIAPAGSQLSSDKSESSLRKIKALVLSKEAGAPTD